MPKVIVKIMTTSVHAYMSITMNDKNYNISGIDSPQEYPLEARWLIDQLLTNSNVISTNSTNGPSGEIYFSEYNVDLDAICEILDLNLPATEKYATTRTKREYKLSFSPISMYGGTYDLSIVLTSLQNKIADILTVDLLDTNYHPSELDFDVQEIATYALHYLSINNRELTSIELVK